MDPFDESESESESKSESESVYDFILLPGTEIPESLKFNHQSFGNSISFKVGCKFPKLAVCVAFRSAEAHKKRRFYVHVSINGCKQKFNEIGTKDSYEQLWLFSKSLGQLNKPNLSEQNQVEVEVKCESWDRNVIGNQIKWLGVNVECTSDRSGRGSSLVSNDIGLPLGLLVVSRFLYPWLF